VPKKINEKNHTQYIVVFKIINHNIIHKTRKPPVVFETLRRKIMDNEILRDLAEGSIFSLKEIRNIFRVSDWEKTEYLELIYNEHLKNNPIEDYINV